ncbi:leucyl/phenylalanyl-tRNA--protein transferase [Spiribacter vilamensis]|uniref:Leucyl/phenylalanyl-tRNA--protein transferase n=1 Tax=Spiribacter vilamensis TaxID=531306 RepID=A0A4Q8CYY1_9GAMM|nr:leucyl/phenylalanyl-tRNA--protein transferase [Spiribacter vilamensis]RZU98110.1 leucyl/phenylalanyl-tRNA--protein transferase [Spiribacter vilamensis]TVO60988.1 leucyl/phenylalanyl-tRNA--protein transferase [Spiribacter vilamensis]
MTEPALPIPWLAPNDETTPLPDPETALAEPNGLLAIGASLSPQRLESAYRNGIFPWYSPGEPVLWWSPDPRALITPSGFHMSRSLRRQLRKTDYQVSLDTAFEAVIAACAAPRLDQPETWITPEMADAYYDMHTLGLAHSIEVWRGKRLIGGLYGVSTGRAFFGESMFSHATNGSKIALAWLLRQLGEWGFDFLDCQMPTEHLLSLGAEVVPRKRFLLRLAASQRGETRPGAWSLSITRDDVTRKWPS